MGSMLEGLCTRRTESSISHIGRISRLFGQGVDIAPFLTELATINLFRQRVDDPGNFPRILNEDFMDILQRSQHPPAGLRET